MKIPQTIEPSFDDYISIAYMINLFKSHKKIIFIPVIIGAIMGGPLTNFIEPVYKGSAFFSFAKVSGVLVMDPQVFASKTYVNNFFSKKTYENCNPSFYKDKDFNYDISTIVKTLSLKDSDLIELNMQNKNKTVIKDCLNSMIDDLRTSQNTIADPIIQLKINNLRLAEEKLKNNEEFLIKLIDKQIRGLKKNGKDSSENMLYSNISLFINKDIKQLMSEINIIKLELSIEQIKLASEILPIRIEKKSSLSPKLGALLGLFLGLCLGILLALTKQIKI